MKAIMYHYVREEDSDFPHFRHLHVEDFRQQLDYFARQFRFCSTDDVNKALRTGDPVANGVVLTFDDGFKDHFRYVLPELLRRGIMGIFYIPTSPYQTGKLLDVHRIHVLIGRHGGKEILQSALALISPEMLSHEHVREFKQQTYSTQTNDDYTNQVKRTLNYFIDYKYRESVIDALMAKYFPDEKALASDFYATKDEIKQMQDAGMLIGSHTVNHPCLSKLEASEQQREIEDSFAFLERVAGPSRLKTFCYPYGGFHSFTPDTEKILEKAGCAFSFNVERRDIGADDLRNRKQALPRYDCNLFPHGSVRENRL